jgi:hypothetical protein
MVPSSTSMRVVTSPVVVPVGIAAGVLDVFVVHPIVVLPDAARDTKDVWTRRANGYVTDMGTVIPRAAVTPVVFAGSWAGRSFFNVGRGATRAPSLGNIDTAISTGNRTAVRQWLVARDTRGTNPDASARLRTIVAKFGGDAELHLIAINKLFESRENDAFLLDRLRVATIGVNEYPIVQGFAAWRSREAGEIMLQKIFVEPMPVDRINLYLSALLRIGDPDQIRRLTERLKRGGGYPGAHARNRRANQNRTVIPATSMRPATEPPTNWYRFWSNRLDTATCSSVSDRTCHATSASTV